MELFGRCIRRARLPATSPKIGMPHIESCARLKPFRDYVIFGFAKYDPPRAPVLSIEEINDAQKMARQWLKDILKQT